MCICMTETQYHKHDTPDKAVHTEKSSLMTKAPQNLHIQWSKSSVVRKENSKLVHTVKRVISDDSLTLKTCAVFFFFFPSNISGVHHFGVRFLPMWPFSNPTTEVVTFCLRGCLCTETSPLCLGHSEASHLWRDRDLSNLYAQWSKSSVSRNGPLEWPHWRKLCVITKEPLKLTHTHTVKKVMSDEKWTSKICTQSASSHLW